MSQIAIEVSGLQCHYPETRDGAAALSNVDLRVNQGDFVVVGGPNDAGKSTLIACLGGLIPKHISANVSGSIKLLGRPIETYSPTDLAGTVGVVLDDPDSQLFGSTVMHYLAFGLELRSYPREVMIERIEDAAQLLGVSNLLERSCHVLSGGEKQRVVVASMLVMRPSMLIFDEPTSQLDPIGTRELFAALKHLNQEAGLTIVLAEHKLGELSGCASHLVVLDRGEVRAYGRFRDVLSEPLGELLRYPQAAEVYLACKERDLGEGASLPLTVDEGVAFVEGLLKTKGEPA